MSTPERDSGSPRVVEEIEAEDGWKFRVEIDLDADHSRALTMRLAWVDYNLWSPSGSDRPADVAQAVLALLMECVEPGSIPARLDAARIRHIVSDADKQLPKLIRQHPPQ